MARIDRFTSRADAQVACGMLVAHGIDAYLSGDDAGGVFPQFPYSLGGTVVIVPDEQEDEALALLDVQPDLQAAAELDRAAGFEPQRSLDAQPDRAAPEPSKVSRRLLVLAVAIIVAAVSILTAVERLLS